MCGMPFRQSSSQMVFDRRGRVIKRPRKQEHYFASRMTDVGFPQG